MVSSRFSVAKTNVVSKAVSSLVQRKSTDRTTKSEPSHFVSIPSSYWYTRETIRSTETSSLVSPERSMRPSFNSLCPFFSSSYNSVSLHDHSKIIHVLLILLYREKPMRHYGSLSCRRNCLFNGQQEGPTIQSRMYISDLYILCQEKLQSELIQARQTAEEEEDFVLLTDIE